MRDGQASGLRGFTPPIAATAPSQGLLAELQRLGLEAEALRKTATPRGASHPPSLAPWPSGGSGTPGPGSGVPQDTAPGTPGIARLPLGVGVPAFPVVDGNTSLVSLPHVSRDKHNSFVLSFCAAWEAWVWWLFSQERSRSTDPAR